jgi:glycosyltransferase involved in cell wall biosynthesis
MTFIASHAEGLQRYQAVYAGSRRVTGLALPAGRAFAANTGGAIGLAREFAFRRLRMAGGLAAALRQFEPKLVHAHFGQSGPAALELADALGVPLIVTYHGQDATISEAQARQSWRGREYLRGRKKVMKRASVLIAVSDFIRNRMLEQGYPADRVVTHRNGIDLEYFAPTGQARKNTVLFVGRFVEKKGCEYLIRALGVLREEGCAVRGVLVGDGPLRSGLERLAQQAGADVEFKGFLGLSEVRSLLAIAAVAVVPSVTAADGNSEGLPTVILEAQAMATPVIATRHAGNAEGVVEGKSALLVDERDVHGLASGIRLLVDDPAMARRFGAHGRQFMERAFSIESQVAALERIYDTARRKA